MARLKLPSLPFRAPIARLSSRASETWSGLSMRERRLLGLVAVAVVVAAVFTVGMTMRRAILARENSLQEKQVAMQKVAVLAASYREAEAARQRIEARIKGPPVRLFSYLEELAKKESVAIGDMQDRGTDNVGPGITRAVVEVNFAQIDMRSLVAFLNSIEKSPHLVKVEKLRLRTRGDSPDKLDATLTVSTYQLS
jgi:hypothetical protein